MTEPKRGNGTIGIKKSLLTCWCIAVLTAASFGDTEKGLLVYGDVPGVAASDQFLLSVRSLGENERWQKPFAFITRCKDQKSGDNRYFEHLSGWSNTYINFEMDRPVEVEIVRADGKAIRSAAPHPRRKVKSCEVRDGKAYLTLTEPCLIAVDIDGQMDDQDTGKGYQGPPIHTVTIFANPFLKDRPQPDGPGVLAVAPGQTPSSEGDWKTLYFLPGVHDIGVAFPVHANRNYYIPGDAIVHGTLHNHGKWNDGNNIRIFGHGTLSGERIDHPRFAKPSPVKESHHSPIHIVGAANTTVEGITIADSAFHSLMLIMGHKPEEPTDMRWVKIFTWRANGDGINPFGNGLIENCFIRTQDDGTYVNGRGIRNVTFWNDYNGSVFVLSALPDRRVVVEDCDVIYARAGWNKWSGGRLFNMRGEGGGASGKEVVFRNIRVEDQRPTLQHFMIAMEGVEPYSDPSERKREPGDLSGVLFQNIEIAAPSVLGESEILWGSPQAWIKGLTFENVTIGGKKISSLDDFKHNEFVEGLIFK